MFADRRWFFWLGGPAIVLVIIAGSVVYALVVAPAFAATVRLSRERGGPLSVIVAGGGCLGSVVHLQEL